MRTYSIYYIDFFSTLPEGVTSSGDKCNSVWAPLIGNFPARRTRLVIRRDPHRVLGSREGGLKELIEFFFQAIYTLSAYVARVSVLRCIFMTPLHRCLSPCFEIQPASPDKSLGHSHTFLIPQRCVNTRPRMSIASFQTLKTY